MSKRIALVEDDQALRENYVAALNKQGYEVLAYANRKVAEQAFASRLPDLALIDIGLQDELDGGFAVCQQLRSMSKTLPIIFFTARDNDYDTICGLRMGADDYLTKDISFPHLLARIAALFRRTELLNQP
ncbi:MAG: response regulator, partial [Paraglaciecola sp.]|nr:response regulator [Paraglaciecola sp.]